ncbi:MAG: hypothetical protein CM1200mP36_08370 [Gammaproteobacteria bacterium]|nr:MAG: hypothetical protein CM1200mP36_08370 [Gammaproteobacteria bacterium]
MGLGVFWSPKNLKVDGARDIRVFGRPDKHPLRYTDRLISRCRQYQLALLLRSTDGVPVGCVRIALATVILPTLSEQHAKGSSENFNATLDWALRLVLVGAFPAALGLIVLAEPPLITIFMGASLRRSM